MYSIIELAKRKVNLQRSPPEGHAQAYREMIRQACDAANREAKRRKKGHIADDTQELLVLILPRLLLPAPKRTPGNNTKVKTHAEAMQETAQSRQQATKLVAKRIALAQEGNFAELLRRDELEPNEQLKTRLAKPEEAEGADDEEEGAQKATAAAMNLEQKEFLTRAMKRLSSHGIASLGPEETEKVSTLSAQRSTPNSWDVDSCVMVIKMAMQRCWFLNSSAQLRGHGSPRKDVQRFFSEQLWRWRVRSRLEEKSGNAPGMHLQCGQGTSRRSYGWCQGLPYHR